MNTHPSVQDLESLISGALDEDRSILISAHADDCAVCGRELAWLRAERELFAQRARGVPPSEVWAQIESKIADRLRQESPAPRGLRRVFASAFRSERMQWYAVAGAALAVVGMVAVSPLSPLRRATPEPVASLSISTETPGAAGPADAGKESAVKESDETDDIVRSRAPLKGPIALDVSTLAADVDVVAGPKDEATLSIEDGHVTTARFIPPANGQTAWRIDFAGGSSLASGQLRLQLPEGSQINVHSASGDVRVSGLKGDVTATTAAGEIAIKDAKAATLVSVSGDMDLRDVVGAIDAKTTSGELHISGEVVQALRYTSVSGDLMLMGPCRVAACQIAAQTTSGNVSILRRADQSLAIQLRSHSGEISGTDGLPVEMKRSPGQATEWSTRLGSGTGSLRLSTQSGDIDLLAP